MATIARRAIAFAGTTVIVLMAIDLVMSTMVAPSPPAAHRQTVLLSHTVFHVGALVLSFAGAASGFACVRRRQPTLRQSAVLGVVFGLASLVGGAIVAVVEGPLSAGLWLFFGSMSFAIGGALLAKPWRTEGHV